MSKLLVIDTEVIPDEEMPKALRPNDEVLKSIACEIVTISYLKATIPTRPGEAFGIEMLGSLTRQDRTEAAMLADFWKAFGHYQPRLLTWNGRGFDVPVLRMRSLKHLVTTPWFTLGQNKFESYAYRYANWHVDLMDVMSDYGGTQRLALDPTAAALGLPGKIGGHGADVADMIATGDHEQCRRYCEADSLNLYGIYLRWLHVTGALDAKGYKASVMDLAHYLQQHREDEPHYGEFLDAWAEGRAAIEEAAEAGREPENV